MYGQLLHVNPALVTMLGYDSEEDLLRRNTEKDIYRNPQTRLDFLKKHGHKEDFRAVEAEWRRKDGKIITVRMTGHPVLGRDNSLAFFEVFAEDITERQPVAPPNTGDAKRDQKYQQQQQRLQTQQVSERTTPDETGAGSSAAPATAGQCTAPATARAEAPAADPATGAKAHSAATTDAAAPTAGCEQKPKFAEAKERKA